MKSRNPYLVLLLLLFSLAIKVQAQQSNGHLPQCPSTAPQVVIQAVAAPQGQCKNLRMLAVVVAVVVVIVVVTGATAGALLGVGAGYDTEKALINEDAEFPGWGGRVGGILGGVVGGGVGVGVGVVGIVVVVKIVIKKLVCHVPDDIGRNRASTNYLPLTWGCRGCSHCVRFCQSRHSGDFSPWRHQSSSTLLSI